ncbi:MAG: hypothetical protein R2819_14105 [Allomuricauda sp.]
MKKLIYPIIFIAGVFVLWAPMNAFQDRNLFKMASVSRGEAVQDYSAKYKDCISKDSFSSQNTLQINSLDYQKVGDALKKYEQTLVYTLKNLSSIDAHNFLHQEFQRSKDTVFNQDLSELQLYYHNEIMRICFEKDRLLNLSSSQEHL